MRSPPPTMMITPPQITPPEKADELPRNTETPTAEVSLPDQYQNEKGDQVRDVTVVENTPVGDPDARPIRQKIPNTRYVNVSFSDQTKSRRTPRRAE